MLLFKDEKHQYLFAVNRQGENKSVFLKRIGESEQILASDTISGNTKEIYLKVISQGTHYDFYYSLKEKKIGHCSVKTLMQAIFPQLRLVDLQVA